MRMLRFTLLILSLSVVFGACAGDPDTSDRDTGTGDADGSGEVCEVETPPEHADACDCEGGTWSGRVDLCDRTCSCEFGSWACEEDCDPTPVFKLVLSDSPTVDEQSGNGDTDINPGETWSVSGTIAAENPGDDTATTVRLQSDSIYVEVDGSSSDLAEVGVEPIEFTLEFDVLQTAPGGTVVLTVEAFAGFTTDSVEVEIEIVPEQIPVFVFDDIEVLNDTGGPAGRIEAGDTITIATTLSNDGPVAAEGVSVTASPSSETLSSPEAFSVGTLAAGGDVEVSFDVTVADAPTVFDPLITLAASGTNASTVTDSVDVTVYPPETLEVLDYEFVGDGPTYSLVVTVHNTGTFSVPGLSWTRINYASSDVPEALQDTYPDADCVDQIPPDPLPEGWTEPPCYTSMELGEPSGPASLAPDAEADVTLSLTVDGSTPDIGLVILRATSSLRSHGPFNLELTKP